MFEIVASDIDALDEQFAAFPTTLQLALLDKANDLSQALLQRVRDGALAGEVLQSRSGALAASLVAELTSGADAIVASLASVDVKYAAIQEYGGTTPPHEILPSKGAALAFLSGGHLQFARRIEHPGSVIPERSYLRSTLADMSDEIASTFADAADGAWSQS